MRLSKITCFKVVHVTWKRSKRHLGKVMQLMTILPPGGSTTKKGASAFPLNHYRSLQ